MRAPSRAAGELLSSPVLHALKTAVAAGLSWFLAADVLGNPIPVFAPLAALLTVQVTVWESVSRGLQRVFGVVVGVLVAFGFARLAGVHPWSIGLIIFVSLLAGRALRLGTQGSIQVPVSALLVLVLGATTGGYGYDRVVDTAIGAGVGIAVNLVLVPRRHLGDAQAEVRGFAEELAGLLKDFAANLGAPVAGARGEQLDAARHLSRGAASAARAVSLAEESTRWNPAGRRDRPAVDNLKRAVADLSLVERQVRGIARALADSPAGQSLPAEVEVPLSRLLTHVASPSLVTRIRVGSSG